MDLAAAADHVADVLETVDIPASVDPAEVTVPGAWISLREVAEFTICGGGTVLVDVYLIAPDTMPRDALRILSELAALAMGVLDVEQMTTNDAVALPDGGRPKPAFKITTKIEVD